jgi:hypothetical protein
MELLSKKLARSENAGVVSIWHWCPGCGHMERYVVERRAGAAPGPLWSWNGNVEKPSFSPSMRAFVPLEGGVERTTCHYFVTEGQIAYCADSPHKLSGQTVPLPDLPDWFVNTIDRRA